MAEKTRDELVEELTKRITGTKSEILDEIALPGIVVPVDNDKK